MIDMDGMANPICATHRWEAASAPGHATDWVCPRCGLVAHLYHILDFPDPEWTVEEMAEMGVLCERWTCRPGSS